MARCHGNTETNLSLLRLILVILGKEMGENVATAASNMNEGTFLAETQTGRHRQHHANGFDDQRPLAEVTTDDKAT